ncbi:MAG: hypothetical protein JNL62_25515 [Bryobacterales bacterium]|nr:hypothetical protein [Bryobacterales bacterium]
MRGLVAEQERKYRQREGRPLDYSRAWWTPPLSAAQAWRIEVEQIERKLGLSPLVSLTDHDSIDAPLLLHVTAADHPAPISLEWTVPFQRTFFHLGVHNVPQGAAGELMEAMRRYTAAPREGSLTELLEVLNADPEILLVLNHPLWDEAGIGSENHKEVVRAFLGRHGRRLHAVELNGLRCWRENRAVLALGEALGMPVVSGGDRHGCEPNAMINLSNACCFAEFVREVRIDRQSHVMLLPQCLEPLGLRCYEVLRDALSEMPEAAGRERWSDRVFYRLDSGVIASFSEIWGHRPPAVVRYFVWLVQLFTNPGIRTLMRAALLRNQEMPS